MPGRRHAVMTLWLNEVVVVVVLGATLARSVGRRTSSTTDSSTDSVADSVAAESRFRLGAVGVRSRSAHVEHSHETGELEDAQEVGWHEERDGAIATREA